MRNALIRVLRGMLAIAIPWATVAMIHSLKGTNRSIASMALVLEVLATSTFGDRLLAIVASLSATFGFSWYYVDQVGSFAITTPEGELTFSMMMLTALLGSHLAIRAQERAAEAMRRREEMERLHQLGASLLAAATVSMAAQNIVNKIVSLFGVRAAVLSIEDHSAPFEAGFRDGPVDSVVQSEKPRYALELYGRLPSAEVRSALKNLIDLVLYRARAAEQQAHVDAAHRGEEFRKTVLNSLAHNFKTPLTSIKAAASILRGSLAVPEANAKELATVIDEESDRLDQMIRESLDLARIEAHQASPRHESCSAAEIVETVASRVSRHLGGRRLVTDVPDDLPVVLGDRFLIEQMVIQLVDNAWKYSQAGALILVRSGVSDGMLFMEVTNQGDQIPVEEREKIFTKFYRGRQTRSHVEGTGMGLPLARAIAEAHGGYLEVSTHPLGPSFRFALPVGHSSAIPIQSRNHDHDSEPQHISR